MLDTPNSEDTNTDSKKQTYSIEAPSVNAYKQNCIIIIPIVDFNIALF